MNDMPSSRAGALPNCANCKFAQDFYGNPLLLSCRRNPTTGRDSFGEPQFPRTTPANWCGEHQRQPPGASVADTKNL